MGNYAFLHHIPVIPFRVTIYDVKPYWDIITSPTACRALDVTPDPGALTAASLVTAVLTVVLVVALEGARDALTPVGALELADPALRACREKDTEMG